MRMGVLGADATITIQGPLPPTYDPIVPGQSMAGGSTTGPSVTGDTLVCPPGYPYDYTIHDCSGKNPADVAAQEAQALMDACTSGGGTWNLGTNSCVMPGGGVAPVIVPTSLIVGIPNVALYIAGGLLLFALMKGKR